MRIALSRGLGLLATLVALGACGGAATSGGGPRDGETAHLWVTRDRGAEVLLTASVPPGINAIQALDREADVETRYGGRFVQAVNGIEGSLHEGRDWFYLVNGIQPDVGGAEVRLRAGDVVWWDYRRWNGEDLAAPVVAVGALPEPFLHGWGGRRRPAEVRAPPGLADDARSLLEVLGGPKGEGKPNVFVLVVERGAEGAILRATRGPVNDSPVTFTLTGSPSAVRAAATALARDPSIVRFRFEARFDEDGRVIR